MFKNCLYCRGRGTQKCLNCRRGRVDCPRCGASGRITVWLVLDRRFRYTVTVHPRNTAARIHRQIEHPRDFDSGTWPTRLSADTGVQRSLTLPDELLAAIDARAERVVGVRQQTFCTEVHKLAFTTPVGGGTVELAGEPPVVSPTSRWRGLRTRLVVSSTIAFLGIGGAVSLYNDYISQHVWYARHGDGALLVGLGIVTSLLVTMALAILLVARQARSRFAVGMSIGPAAAFAFGTFLAYTHAQPDTIVAQRELAAGNLRRAQDEAQALIDLHRDVAGGEVVLDELHLRRAKSLRTFPELIACIRGSWFTDRARADADAVLRTRVQEAAAELYAKQDIQELEHLGSELRAEHPEMRDGVQWLLAAVRAAAFLKAEDIASAVVQLSIVLELAHRVPQLMRPADAQLITTSASRLASVLTASSAASLGERAKTLSAAVELAREYARLVGMDSDAVAQGLVNQQNEAARAAERGLHRAVQQVAHDRETPAADQQAEPTNGVPVDPYGVPIEPADGDATQQRDRPR